MKRFDAVTRSPVFASFSAILKVTPLLPLPLLPPLLPPPLLAPLTWLAQPGPAYQPRRPAALCLHSPGMVHPAPACTCAQYFRLSRLTPTTSPTPAAGQGLPTIRAYAAGPRFRALFLADLSRSGSWWFCFLTCARWIGFRLGEGGVGWARWAGADVLSAVSLKGTFSMEARGWLGQC